MKRLLFICVFLMITVTFTGVALAQDGGYFYDPTVDAETHLENLVPSCYFVQPELFSNNVLDVADAQGFTTFAAAVRAAGAEDLLTTKNGFTIFAPTNEAFDALPPGKLDELLANPGELRQVILYHILQDEYLGRELPNGDVRTGLGKTVRIIERNVVNQASIVQYDITDASNGIIHGINSVLLPPTGVFTTRSRPPAPPQELSAECECHLDAVVHNQREVDPDWVSYGDRVDALANASSFDSYTVQSGDTLAQISYSYYGTGNMWEAIYNANGDVIGNPSVVIPGTVLQIPLE